MMERLSPIFISDAFLQDMALGGIILSCIFNMFIRGQNSGVVTEPEGPYPLHCTRETNILGRMSGGRGGANVRTLALSWLAVASKLYLRSDHK